jgi:hypothetical protein
MAAFEWFSPSNWLSEMSAPGMPALVFGRTEALREWFAMNLRLHRKLNQKHPKQGEAFPHWVR